MIAFVEYKPCKLYLLATKHHSSCVRSKAQEHKKELKPRQNSIPKAPQNTETSMPTPDRRTMLHTLNSS
jgi:hypothetical protein